MIYSLKILGRKIGQLFEVAEDVKGGVTWSTDRIGSPAKLEFTLMKDFLAAYHEGDPVMLAVDGKVIFRGYVFSKQKNDKGEIATVCYDQLRYLKASQTYNWENYNLAEAVQHIATDFQLKVGSLPDTGYRLPYGHFQEQTLMDTIAYYQTVTTVNTGIIWVFYDDDGELTLKKAEDMTSGVVLGDNSLSTGYTYETSIDKDTYNQIKLVRPNEETGRADVYMGLSEETIAQWGILQLYEVVDEELNPAQIEEMVKQRLAYHNRVSRTLTLPCFGVPSIRAGAIVQVYIPTLGDIELNQRMLIDSAVHKFSSKDHTMTLTAEVIL